MFKQFSRPSPNAVEQKADQITDPVERLRYLRKYAPATVHEPEAWDAGTPSRVRRARVQSAAISVAAVLGVGLSSFAWHPEWFVTPPPRPKTVVTVPSAGPTPAHIWQVSASATEEVYSNGLRIDTTFATRNRPRAEYPVFPYEASATAPVASVPRGIVFHTTESDLVPFEEAENRKIEVLGTYLLRYVRREHSYHYLVDRFGRVFRVVEESDAANHAGFSVWGDEQGLYVNLNDSFIGISFEGQTGQRDSITAGQVSAARLLTELLRERYDISPGNCVTHAQVSVNPANMRLANHMDWARGFPWESFGLPDNYKLKIPAVTAFGFGYDDSLRKASGGEAWPGLAQSDGEVARQATAQGASLERYQGMLRHRYQELLTEVRRRANEPADTGETAAGKTSR